MKYRQWIMDTELGDNISGRIMEYSWHSEFSFFWTPLRILGGWMRLCSGRGRGLHDRDFRLIVLRFSDFRQAACTLSV
jgi:hypothetical protein